MCYTLHTELIVTFNKTIGTWVNLYALSLFVDIKIYFFLKLEGISDFSTLELNLDYLIIELYGNRNLSWTKLFD